jgi:hypothetical protein
VPDAGATTDGGTAGAEAPEVDEAAGLPARSRYYFTEMLGSVPASSGRLLADRLMTSGGRARAIERDALRYLARLLEVNGARIRNDLEERILESRRRLEADVRRRLREVRSLAERSLEAALGAQGLGAPAVAAESERLDRIARQLAAIRVT